MSDKLESTEPGGESTQYESIKTVTEEPDKQSGQLGGGMPSSSPILERLSSESKERREKKDGQGISDGGFGRMTTSSDGSANQGGYGGTKAQEESASDTRGLQKYGPGNDVGA